MTAPKHIPQRERKSYPHAESREEDMTDRFHLFAHDLVFSKKVAHTPCDHCWGYSDLHTMVELVANALCTVDKDAREESQGDSWKLQAAREALEKIAGEDFRGNRPFGAVVAFDALAKINEGEK